MFLGAIFATCSQTVISTIIITCLRGSLVLVYTYFGLAIGKPFLFLNSIAWEMKRY